MICLEIALHGQLLWRAGIENATMLAPMLSSFVRAEDLADQHASGMCELSGERSAHVYRGEPAVLRAGDECCRVFVRSFNGAGQGDDRPQTQWLRAHLALGDSLEVQVLNT